MYTTDSYVIWINGEPYGESTNYVLAKAWLVKSGYRPLETDPNKMTWVRSDTKGLHFAMIIQMAGLVFNTPHLPVQIPGFLETNSQ